VDAANVGCRASEVQQECERGYKTETGIAHLSFDIEKGVVNSDDSMDNVSKITIQYRGRVQSCNHIFLQSITFLLYIYGSVQVVIAMINS